MDKQPIVSIIVPVYMVEKYLDRCVNSILVQKYIQWELILVDDGSPDNCPALCDKWTGIDDRIKVIHKENGGQSTARNAALEVVKGDYILFVDSDDFIHSDCIYDCVKIAIKENAGIVQHTHIKGTDDVFPAIKKDFKKTICDKHSIFYSKFHNIAVWGKLYRSELWKDVRMPEGKIYEDDGTTWKLYYKSQKTVYINTPYYYYTVNPTSTMAGVRKYFNLAFIEHYEERIAFFEKENDKLLTDLSKWRFCLPLMLGYMKGNVRKDDLPVLLKHFYRNNRAAICCCKVPLTHRVLIALFSCCPYLFRGFFVLLNKAHTVD